MGGLDWRMLFCALTIASNFKDAAQLVIKEQRVPVSVLVGKDEYIILDCDYDLQDTPIDDLVVKWWHNENDLVYQWIHGNSPQASGVVEGYIDLGYKASKDLTTIYRAMKLNRPGTNLTGDYTCAVSTAEDEVAQTKPMIVFTTGKLELKTKKTIVNGVDGVELTCHAKDVYPKPTLDVSVDNTPVEVRPVVTSEPDERLFNITTRVELRDDDITDPSSLTCVLGIPLANYTDTETEMYHPGPPTTTTTATSTTLQRKMDIQALDNSQQDTQNGGGNSASSFSRGLITVIVGVTALSSATF